MIGRCALWLGIPLLVLGRPALAEGSGADAATRLSGPEVRALSVAYAQAQRTKALATDNDDLEKTRVFVETGAAIRITIARTDAPSRSTSYSYDLSTGTIGTDSGEVAPPNTTVLSGLAAKALTVAYRSWTTKAPGALSRDAFEHDTFDVSVFSFDSVVSHCEAFMISLMPVPPVHVMTGCSLRSSYSVDVRSWTTKKEGVVC